MGNECDLIGNKVFDKEELDKYTFSRLYIIFYFYYLNLFIIRTRLTSIFTSNRYVKK